MAYNASMGNQYFHATPVDNMPSINVDGIRAGYDGAVYLAPSAVAAASYILQSGADVVAVFAVTLDQEPQPWTDGLATAIGGAWVHYGDIPADSVRMIGVYGAPAPVNRGS